MTLQPQSSARRETPSPLALEAVTYAYPLYEMSRMRAATSPRRCAAGTAGDTATSPLRWCNVFVHARELFAAGTSRVVTPNCDTLYTNAWLDLGPDALVIDVPDTAGRYYVLGLLDFYTNPFASLGSRTTGTAARSFLVTGPGWTGDIPAKFRRPGAHVVSPTRWVWIIGRTLVDGPQDLPVVHALQNGFRLRSLSVWQAGGVEGRPSRFNPRCDPKAPPDATRFAETVQRALEENPPPEDERAMVERFAAVGLAAEAGPLDEATRETLEQALQAVIGRLQSHSVGPGCTGWQTMPFLGHSFGTDYLRRAAVALRYIGALESREATYLMAHRDAQGRTLDGRHTYRLHFPAGALPPVDAFWSLTMYDSRDCMLVDNPIDRHAIGDRTPGLRLDGDGGLTIHIQHLPLGAVANWLPAPAGSFYLCLRAYVPREAMIDGRYVLPPVERVATIPGDPA